MVALAACSAPGTQVPDAGTLSDFFRKGSATGTFTCEVAALGGPGKDTFSVTTSGGYSVYGKLTTGSVKTMPHADAHA